MHHKTKRWWKDSVGKFSVEEWESEDGKSWHMISQKFEDAP